MRDGRIDIRERCIIADEAANVLGSLAGNIGTDIVQHDRAEQGRTCGGETHAEQAAEAGADRDRIVQMQGGADVQHVAKAGLGCISGYIARPAGLAAAGVIERHDTPFGTQCLSKIVEIARSPHDARQAEQRRARIAVPPFADK